MTEVASILKLEEGSQAFQNLVNQEMMGVDVGTKRQLDCEASEGGSCTYAPNPSRSPSLLRLDQAS